MKRTLRYSSTSALVAVAALWGCMDDPAEPSHERTPIAFATVTPGGAGTAMGSLGGFFSRAYGVNDAGIAVGEAARSNFTMAAFMWTQAGGMHELLPALGASRARDISSDTVIVGSVEQAGVRRAFRWGHTGPGALEILADLSGGQGAEALAVNSSGVTVGIAFDASGGSVAVLWDVAGTIVPLTAAGAEFGEARDINNAGIVAGVSFTDEGERAFKWSVETGLQLLPGSLGVSSAANGINNAGFIVGHIDNQAKRWSPGGDIVDLGSIAESTGDIATAINQSGQIIGRNHLTTFSVGSAFIWDSSDGMTSFGTPEADVFAINAPGLIVGADVSGGAAVYWQVGSPSAEDSVRIELAPGESPIVRPSFSGFGTPSGDTTVALRISVVQSGLPQPNRSVRLVIAGVDTTGGHVQHVGLRPSGSFRDSTGIKTDTTITTSAGGIATINYRAPVFSGRVLLTATSTGAQTATETFIVQVAGLDSLANALPNLQIIGRTHEHPFNNYGTPGMLMAIRQLADSLALFANNSPSNPRRWRRPGTSEFPSQLGVNDISLVWGGKFDIAGTWDTQARRHEEHRLGETADINVQDEATWDEYMRAVRFIWETKLGHTLHDERATDSPHVHIRW